MENLQIAYLQTDLVWEDIDANLEQFSASFSTISQPVDLIVLPETFNTAFCHNIEQLAEQPDGKTTQFLLSKAKEMQSVITGSLFIKENGKIYNRLIWAKPNGTYEYYDKKHAFILSEEAQTVSTGNKLCTFELKGWKIRPFICYDLRFPCWTRNRFTEEEGFTYDVFLCIANWPGQRASVWHTLSIARAMENVAYVIAVNRVGTDGYNNPYIGDSMAVDFKGEIISKAEDNKASVEYVSLDFDKLSEFRKKFPVHLDWEPFKLM